MLIHKNLRYLLVGSLALTSLVSYSNTDEEKQEKLEAIKEENPGINIKAPGSLAKIGHVVSLSLLGGVSDVCTGAHIPEALYLRLSKIQNTNKIAQPYKLLATILAHALPYIPGAIAVVYDIPKIVTHTRFTEGHIVNKDLEEGHDSRSALRDFIVFLGSRVATTKLTNFLTGN